MNFISKSKTYNTIQEHINAPLFKKIFEYNGGSINLKICGLGFYEVYINRKNITKGLLAPFISNPDHYVYYDEYDLKDYVNIGKNVINVILGNGYINECDYNIWKNEDASYRSSPKLYCEITEDNKVITETDESWMVKDSPILFDEFRAGVWYDARLENKDDFISFNYDGFTNSIIVDNPKGKLEKCVTNPIKSFEHIKPVNIFKSKEGYVFDFGINTAGLPLLKINGKKGLEIDLYCAEDAFESGVDYRGISFDKRTIEGYIQHDKYICKDGYQEWMPNFTFHGFRYCEVKGLDESYITKDLLELVVVHSLTEKAGYFNCSNEVINKLQKIILNSDLSNYQYYMMDCPQREKNGWTADAALSCEQMLYNFNPSVDFKEWIKNIRCAQREDGAIPAICPTAGFGFDWGNGPAWDYVIFEYPYLLYKFTNDLSVLEDNVDMMVKYFEYLPTKFNDSKLFAFGLCDWFQTYAFSSSGTETPVEMTDTLMVVYMSNLFIDILNTLNMNEEKNRIIDFKNTLIKNFRLKFLRNGLLYLERETALSMCLEVGIFNDDEWKANFNLLLEMIHFDNDHFRVGTVGYKFLFEVLFKNGYQDLAHKLISQDSWPSYGFLIKQGYTSLPENMLDYRRDGGMLRRADGGSFMTSFNHHFWGAISGYFYKYYLGIEVISYNEVIINPRYIKDLSFAEGYHILNGNKIEVSWTRINNEIHLHVNSNNVKVSVNVNGKYILNEGDNEYVIK